MNLKDMTIGYKGTFKKAFDIMKSSIKPDGKVIQPYVVLSVYEAISVLSRKNEFKMLQKYFQEHVKN